MSFSVSRTVVSASAYWWNATVLRNVAWSLFNTEAGPLPRFNASAKPVVCGGAVAAGTAERRVDAVFVRAKVTFLANKAHSGAKLAVIGRAIVVEKPRRHLTPLARAPGTVVTPHVHVFNSLALSAFTLKCHGVELCKIGSYVVPVVHTAVRRETTRHAPVGGMGLNESHEVSSESVSSNVRGFLFHRHWLAIRLSTEHGILSLLVTMGHD